MQFLKYFFELFRNYFFPSVIKIMILIKPIYVAVALIHVEEGLGSKSYRSLGTEQGHSKCTEPQILCGVIEEPFGKQFDTLVQNYFKTNKLDNLSDIGYLKSVSANHAKLVTFAGTDQIIKIALNVIAQKTIGKYKQQGRGFFKNLFKKNTNALSYGLHRVLGAIEFVGKLNEGHQQREELCLAVLNAATIPSGYFTRNKMTTLIKQVGNLDGFDRIKVLLQIIARSGWTSERNPKVIDRVVKFVRANLDGNHLILGNVIGRIDDLLNQEPLDLSSLGQQIDDILFVDGELVILAKALPLEPQAKTFDDRVKNYFAANKFGARYLARFTREYTGKIHSTLDDESKRRLMARVDKIAPSQSSPDQMSLDPYLNEPNVGVHLALGEIKYLGIVGKYPNPNISVDDHDFTKSALKYIKEHTSMTESDKFIFLELIASCAWTARSQQACLDAMKEYLPSKGCRYTEIIDKARKLSAIFLNALGEYILARNLQDSGISNETPKVPEIMDIISQVVVQESS
jgi:hypothetical protein